MYPSLSGLKEKLSALVPRYIAEVARYDDSLEDIPTRQTYTSTERHVKMSAEVLADRFCIGLERARQTLKATTLRGTRSALLPISRIYRSDRKFGVRRMNRNFATDTFWAKSKTLRRNVANQIYSHKCVFNAVYHLEIANGENVGYSLIKFVSDYGISYVCETGNLKVNSSRYSNGRTPIECITGAHRMYLNTSILDFMIG